jgi:class 3 adenylate cyclase/tetratricopeptide (TPR) repeat protein
MPDSVAQWLDRLGLGEYSETFADNAIDAEVLGDLTDADLVELGVKLGHRKKILKALTTHPDDVAIDAAAKTDDDRVRGAVRDESLAAWERQPGERKPVTMLFADITGSTALTERLDAEEAHELLYAATERMCAAIEQNQGTVCRFMGDGVMAMFGAPIASERHAVEACAAAAAMQQAIREYAETSPAKGLQIRVGLHSGEVVVLTVGEGDKVEYDASGPTVPMAARMEQSAEPGTIYLTAATHALAGDWIEAAALEPISVKGVTDPVTVFKLRRVRAAEESVPKANRTPFVGRNIELNQFRGILEGCVEGGHGQAIYIRGDPGIGKTRLLEEFSSIATDYGLRIHRGLILPFGTGRGQDAIRSLVRSILGIALDADREQRLQASETAMSDGRLSVDQAVFLNDLLDLPQPTAQRALYDAMENKLRNEGKQAVLAALVTAQSGSSPLLVIVEDVHWAEELTLNHLAVLTKTVADCPALLVMTSRIEGDQIDQGWRASIEGSPFASIDLGPLRKEESIALIGEYLDANDALAASCLERAAGNPLFLEQLLRNAQEGAADGLPDSIQSLVLARMDRLSAEHKRALQAASVMGQRFNLDALRHVMESDRYDCAELLEHNLIRAQDDSYLFAHALIQESVYGSLLKRQRQSMHKRAADWFADNDGVLRAQHLDAAGDPQACRAYLEAASDQARAYRYESALRLIESALALEPKQSERHPLICLKAELLLDLGDIESSIAIFEQAEQRAETDVQRCDAWIGHAENLRIQTDYAGGLALLTKAEPIANEHGLTAELSRLHHLRGNLQFSLGQAAACHDSHVLALRFAEQARSPEGEARALGGLGDAEYVSGRMQSGHGYYSRCIEVARRHALGRIEVAHVGQRAWTFLYTGEWQNALAECLTAAELTTKVGHRRAEMNATLCVADCLLELGEFERAAGYAEKALGLARSLGAIAWEPQPLLCMATLEHEAGRHSQARRLAESALEIAKESARAFQAARAHGTLAWVARDDPELRESALLDGERILEEGAIGHSHLLFYRVAMETMLDIDDWARVETYASRLEAFTRAEPLGWAEFYVARARVLAAFGRGQRDQRTFDEIERLCTLADRAGLSVARRALAGALSA